MDDLYEKLAKQKIPVKKHEVVVVNDTTKCQHDFILKGIREAQCQKCGLGVYINGVENFERLRSK